MKMTLAAAAAILVATTAASSAADFAVKAPYGAPAPTSSWTGFYIGGQVGAAWGTTETSLDSLAAPGVAPVPESLDLTQNSRSGFLGGGQIGYNFQSNWAVFGVQADIAALDVQGTTPCLEVISCSARSDWLATVSGRFGGLVTDKTLVYVKGGAAWLNTTQSFNASGLGGLGGGLGALGVGGSAESTSFGGLLGMGAEYAFTQHWSAFMEYDYIDFEKTSVAFNLTEPGVGTATVNTSVRNTLSIAKLGLNYKF